MKNIFFGLLAISVFGCRNYESERYLEIENAALKEIIPELIDLENMISMNDYDTKNLTLYLNATLETRNISFDKVVDSYNSNDEKNEQDIVFQEELNKSKKEKKGFKPFLIVWLMSVF